MAEQGFELNIEGLQEAINKAEKSITKLAKTTNTQTKNIVNSFKSLSDGGLDVFVQKLNQANEVLTKIGNNTQGKGLKQVGTDAAASMDSVIKLIDTLNKLYEEQNKGGRKKRSDSSEAQVAQVNKLYKERIDAFKRLSEIMKASAKGQDIGSDYISSLRGQIMHTESAIQKIKERGNVSKATLAAISQKEMEYMMLLEKEGQKVKELYAESDKAKKDAAQYAANTTYKGSLKYSNNVQTLEEEKKAIEYLEKAKLKLKNTDADYANKLENINQAIRKHEENLKKAGRTAQENAEIEAKAAKKVADAKKKADADAAFKKNTTYQGAIAYSQQTKSINEQIKAIQYLKIARDNLDKSTMGAKQYEQRVKRINDEIKRQQNELKKVQVENNRTWDNMSKSLDKLQGRLTAVFGLAAIKGYISKLITIRGEFEMQKRSLEVLLQSKDKADKLWKQTIDLAVKSPFTTKELVTYTKQLAAYRIESEKLFETNKMLADVSAGLGVDMNRLILAFGQVKAANFLRGTELRQFSEAGVNMLDELAKRFSALEGKAVSVGDVFERVSKRMVSFKDVEAVFQTITSEGGIFYQMQEKQSETLKGMVLNLKDSVDLMMNSIGESQSGVLKGGVEMVKSFVENWRTLRDNLQILLPTLLGLKVAMFGVNVAISKNIPATLHFKNRILGMNGATMTALATFTKAEAKFLGFSKTQWALAKAMQKATLAVRGLKVALSNFLPFAILTVVIELGYAIFSASEAAKALEEGLESIDKDISKDLENNITLYIQLAEKINDVTSSEQEREKALHKLNSALSEILPDEMLQLKYIQSLKGSYDAATQAMKDYYTAKRVEQKKEKVEEVYGGEIDTQVKDLKKDFYDLFDTKFKRENIDYRLGQGVADKIVASYRWAIEKAVDDLKNGKISDLESGIYENLSQYTGVNAGEIYKALALENQGFEAFEKSGIRKNIRETANAIKEYHNEMNDIMSDIQNFGTHEEKQSYELSQEVKADVDNALGKWKSLLSIARQISENKPDENGNRRTIALDKEATSLIEQVPLRYQQSVKTFWDLILEEAEKGTLAFNTSATNLTDALNENVSQIATAANEGNTYVKNFGEEISKSLDTKIITKQGKAVTKVYQNIAKSMNIDENIFDKFILTSEKSIDDVLKSLKAEGDALKEEARKIASSVAAGLSGQEFEDRWGFALEEAEAKQKELITKSQAMTKAWSQLGGTEKEKKGSKGKDWWLELAKGLQSVHKDFLSLNKDLNKNDAKLLANAKNLQVLDIAFQKVGISMDDFMTKYDLTTETGLIDALKSLQVEADETRIAIEKILSDIKGEAEITFHISQREAFDSEFEDMFKDYELSIELESSGMNVDWFAELFNFEKTTTDDIRKWIQKNINKPFNEAMSDSDLRFAVDTSELLSIEQKDSIKEWIKKLSDADAKELEKTIDKFNKLSMQALTSVGKIRVEEARELEAINRIIDKEIEKSEGDTKKIEKLNAVRVALTQGTRDEAEKDVNKAIWEEFKGSEGYITLFQDAQNASFRAINNMLKELEKLRDSLGELNVDELKAVVEAMEKLKSIKFEKLPFTNLAKMIQAGIDKTSYREEKNQLEVDENATLGITGVAKGGFKGIRGNRRLDKSIEEHRNAIAKLREEQKSMTPEEIASSDVTIKKLQKKQEELEKVRAKGLEASRALSEAFSNFGVKLNEIGQSLSTFQNAFENMGVNFSDEMNDAIGTTQEVLGGLGTMIQGFASGNYLQALMGLAQTLGALFQIGDKRKERQIQDNIKAIEKLGKAYEKLEKKIEEAYSIGTLQSATNSAMDNLEEQIQKQEEIIALEKSKKNSDEDKINEYSDELDSQKEQLEEMKKEVVSKATNGAFDDVLSVADEFVDAWLTAFQETGDGLQGLEDNFNDFLLNIVKRQAALSIVGAFTKDMETELKKYVNEKDTKLTADEAGRFSKYVKEKLPGLSENLENFFESLSGVVDVTNQGDTMSGLQRGVTEITEETAGVIAAYLNTIRFYVADSNTQLQKFLQDYNTSANTYLSPILTQVTDIANNTSKIRDLLDSVITAYTGNAGGKGVKMIM